MKTISEINRITRLTWQGDVSEVYKQVKPVFMNAKYLTANYLSKKTGTNYSLQVYYCKDGWTGWYDGADRAGQWKNYVDTPELACVALEAWCYTNL